MVISSEQQRESIKCVHNYVLVSSKLFVHPNRQLLAHIYVPKYTVQLKWRRQSEFLQRFSEKK
jgi:hypothetical protein